MKDFKDFYSEVYAKSTNGTLMFNKNERWLTFYFKGVATTRKVFKNNHGVYYVRFKNEYYKIPIFVFNQKLTDSRNPIINF